MLVNLAQCHIEPDGSIRVKVWDGQSSFSKDAVLTTDYARDGVVRGLGFAFEKNFTIANAATLLILIDYTTFIPTGDLSGLIYVMPPAFSTTAGPVKVNIYRGTDYTGGTAFDCVNLNTTHAKTVSATTFKTGPTGSTKGTVVLQYLVGGASQGNQSASGSAGGVSFFVRPNTGKTLVEIVNESASDITFHFAQVIYEV